MYAFNPKRLSQPVEIQLPLMLKLLRHPLETLVRISRAYGVSLEVLLGVDSIWLL